MYSGGAFILFGGTSVLVEFLLNLTFKVHDVLLWSIYPLAAGIILGLTLIIIGCCRPLRESLREKVFSCKPSTEWRPMWAGGNP